MSMPNYVCKLYILGVTMENVAQWNSHFLISTNLKLVDTSKEYENGYAKCIKVQKNHYLWEMYKQRYQICADIKIDFWTYIDKIINFFSWLF